MIKMIILGVSGLPGSGKSFISEIAIERNAKIISMGDIIRKIAKERGENTNITSIKLRKEYGEYHIAELTIEEVKKSNEDFIIIEGIRSQYEVNLFKENFKNFKIISSFANPKLRFDRLKKRKREDDSTNINEFNERDNRELNLGIGNVIALSDKIIINETDLDNYKKEINKYFDKILIPK